MFKPALPALIALLAVCSVPSLALAETAALPAASDQGLPAITVSTVSTRKLQDLVLASGMIAPVEQVQVAPLIEGQPIEALLADVGDHVVAGQVLARLSTSTLELQKAQLDASYASAMAQIAQGEAQLVDANAAADEARRVADRTAALRKNGSSSQAAADQSQAAATSANARVAVATQGLASARAQVALVQAQLDNVALQLSRAEVRAPVDGEITARNAQIGAIASAAGQPMFSMIRDGALELRADIAEADLTRLSPGLPATLSFVGSTASQTGTIRLIEPTIDVATRLGRARISLPDSASVRSGMFAEAAILVTERDTTAVPVSAIGASGNQPTVMLVKDGVAHLQAVQTGIRDGGWVEILAGVVPGDTVVTRAGAFVRNGDHIHPVPAPADATN
jgi:HlyD family secretion protein